jgi:hypothetical protein
MIPNEALYLFFEVAANLQYKKNEIVDILEVFSTYVEADKRVKMFRCQTGVVTQYAGIRFISENDNFDFIKDYIDINCIHLSKNRQKK